MARLFGQDITRETLRESVGDMAQVCGIQSFTFDDGSGRGVRALEFRTGGGLRFIALPDRAMDIYMAEFRGIPLNWLSGTGPVAPEWYSPHGWDWLRSFFGGLLTTCGLSNVGDACEDRGAYLEKEQFGAHGRISNTPAKCLGYDCGWEGETYVLSARGEMVETAGQGEKLILRRSLRAEMGRASIEVRDAVTNEGYTPVPLMLLYHINLGFPLLGAGARIFASCRSIEGLDAVSAGRVGDIGRLHAPDIDSVEQVFLLDMRPDNDGFCHVALVNPLFDDGAGLGVYLRFRAVDFPYFSLWKRLSKREYVIGFEPGNCAVQGRLRQRERGDLRLLAPGETARFVMELGVLASNRHVEEWVTGRGLRPL
jgi:hypothetical protein